MPITKEPKMMRVNFTAPEELIDQVDQFAKERLEDRSTAIRQLVHEGLMSLLIDRLLRQFQRGGMTLRETAARAGVETSELIDLLIQRGIPVSGEVLEGEPNPKVLKQWGAKLLKSQSRAAKTR
jgi:hypothetical protein